jgi:hypothetical protein
MRKTAVALALAAALPAGAQMIPSPRTSAPPLPAGPRSPSDGPPARPANEAVQRGTVLEEVSGKVAEIDRKGHKLHVATASGPVTLSLDRNTMVYTGNGLGTVLDVVPGAQIRAGRNADFLAYWVQVRANPTPPQSTPGQGTGPAGGGSAPAGEGAGPGAGAPPLAPTTGSGPGSGTGGPGPIGTSPAP